MPSRYTEDPTISDLRLRYQPVNESEDAWSPPFDFSDGGRDAFRDGYRDGSRVPLGFMDYSTNTYFSHHVIPSPGETGIEDHDISTDYIYPPTRRHLSHFAVQLDDDSPSPASRHIHQFATEPDDGSPSPGRGRRRRRRRQQEQEQQEQQRLRFRDVLSRLPPAVDLENDRRLYDLDQLSLDESEDEEVSHRVADPTRLAQPARRSAPLSQSVGHPPSTIRLERDQRRDDIRQRQTVDVADHDAGGLERGGFLNAVDSVKNSSDS